MNDKLRAAQRAYDRQEPDDLPKPEFHGEADTVQFIYDLANTEELAQKYLDPFCIQDVGNDTVGDIEDFLQTVARAFINEKLPESVSAPFWKLMKRMAIEKFDNENS